VRNRAVPGPPDSIIFDNGNATFDSTNASIFNYAVWSPASTSVPEPTTATLLTSSLLGFSVYEWRRRTRTNSR
jgi:hypothetical protein